MQRRPRSRRVGGQLRMQQQHAHANEFDDFGQRAFVLFAVGVFETRASDRADQRARSALTLLALMIKELVPRGRPHSHEHQLHTSLAAHKCTALPTYSLCVLSHTIMSSTLLHERHGHNRGMSRASLPWVPPSEQDGTRAKAAKP